MKYCFGRRPLAHVHLFALCAGLCFGLSACATSRTSTNATVSEGVASYYSNDFQGRKTASGEVFDNSSLTAAHKTLPFGTLVRVTNLKNNAQVMVRVNDRGPNRSDRIIDLSYAAARKLGMIADGLARVKLEVLELVTN